MDVWPNAEVEVGWPKAEVGLPATPKADPGVGLKALGRPKAELVGAGLTVPIAGWGCCAPPLVPLNAECPKTGPVGTLRLFAAVVNADGPGPAKAEKPPLFTGAPPKLDLGTEGCPKAGAPNVEVPCGWANGDVEPEFCTPKTEGCPKAETPPAPNADPGPGPVPVNADVLLGASIPKLCLLAASKAPLMSLRALANTCSAFARAFCSY